MFGCGFLAPAYYRNTGVVGLGAAHVLWPLTSPQLLSPRVPPSCFLGTLGMHLYGTGVGPCTHTVFMEGAVGWKGHLIDLSSWICLAYVNSECSTNECWKSEWILSSLPNESFLRTEAPQYPMHAWGVEEVVSWRNLSLPNFLLPVPMPEISPFVSAFFDLRQ